MSKPWFLKMALEAEPSPLAGVISNILQSTSTSKNGTKPLPPLPPPAPDDAPPTAYVAPPEKLQAPMPNGHRDTNNGTTEVV